MNNVDISTEKCPKCGSQLDLTWRLCTLCLYRATADKDVQPSLNSRRTVEDSIIEAKGIDGTLTLFSNRVRISRKGFASFILSGLKSDKEISLFQISSIKFKEVGGFTKGYILLSFIGEQETKRDRFDTVQYEDSIMFNDKQQPQFEYIKQEIDRRIELLSKRERNLRTSLNLDELEKLASLKDKVIITPETFNDWVG